MRGAGTTGGVSRAQLTQSTAVVTRQVQRHSRDWGRAAPVAFRAVPGESFLPQAAIRGGCAMRLQLSNARGRRGRGRDGRERRLLQYFQPASLTINHFLLHSPQSGISCLVLFLTFQCPDRLSCPLTPAHRPEPPDNPGPLRRFDKGEPST